VAVVAVVVVALAGGVAVKALTGSDHKNEVKGSSKDSFKLSYPNGWRALSKKELRTAAGHPLAVLRRNDGKAFVILRKEKRAPKNFQSFSTDLTKALDKRVPDFQKQSSRIVKLRAGKAFFYTYIRKTKGTVHSIVVVPAGNQSYALNTVSRGGSTSVARQVAQILLSFDR
jgi:hypothetical protein